MKKAIATPAGQPTLHVDLTQAEIDQRVVDEANSAAEQAATAWLRGRQDPLTGYAPIADQLDMQYWDKVNGTNNWQNHVANVKAGNPKP